jgi:hypothetical protein
MALASSLPRALPQTPTGGYGRAGPVLTIQTDFMEKADQILASSRRVNRIVGKYMRIVTTEASAILHQAIQEETPLGPSTSSHIGGQEGQGLWGSTDVSVEITGTVGEGETQQYELEARQDATNPKGIEYAPFVIQGHRTRGAAAYDYHSQKPYNPRAARSAVGGVNAVPANPYPQRALAKAWPELDALFELNARQIAVETVGYMAYGDHLT